MLTFTNEFIADTQPVGGTISLGAYYLPDNLTSPNDTVEVDDPYWLAIAMASILAGNDNTYTDKSVDLNTQADELYKQIALKNRKGTYNNPRVTPTNVNRIRFANGSGRAGGYYG